MYSAECIMGNDRATAMVSNLDIDKKGLGGQQKVGTLIA